MKQLILVGAGSFGREIKAWLSNCKGYNEEWKYEGFIDNDRSRLDSYNRSDEIIDLIDDYQPKSDDVFLCTIADQRFRTQYVEVIQSRGGQFISIIHDTAVVDSDCFIGVGVFVAPFCTISCNVTIGNHVLFNSYAAVGHDVKIGDYCHINSFTLLGGFAQIGDGSTIHPNSVIIPKKRIGKGSTIGAGSIVLKNVKENTTVFGNPAKVIF